MGRVKELEAIWNARKCHSDYDREDFSHKVSFRVFMDELLLISKLTFDKRAIDAKNLIAEVCHANGLTDEHGRWKKNPVPVDDLPPPDYAVEASQLIQNGCSKQEAFATIAVRHSIRAASWKAAIAQVKRAWEKDQSGSGEPMLDAMPPLRNP